MQWEKVDDGVTPVPKPPVKGNATIPQTGDTANPALWLALLALSGVGLVGAYRLRRKEER